jgi:transposase
VPSVQFRVDLNDNLTVRRRYTAVEYYGLDIHKLSITYTCMNEAGRILRRGQVATTPEAIRGIVAPSGGQACVALEATRGWSYVYDTLEPLGVQLFLAHPKRVKAIVSAKVKTDAIDSATLAHLLRTRLLPVSYAPPPSVRSLREMLRTRQGLVGMRSACRHRIHSILAKEGLIVPMSDLFGKKGRRWLGAQSLSAPHRQLVDLLSDQVSNITLAITEIEECLRHTLGEFPVLARLMTVPGLGF